MNTSHVNTICRPFPIDRSKLLFNSGNSDLLRFDISGQLKRLQPQFSLGLWNPDYFLIGFFVSFFSSFYQQIFFATFYLILLYLSIQILTLEVLVLNHCSECKNWYILWKPTKLGIFLILQDLRFTSVWIFLGKYNTSRMTILGYVR